MSAPPAIEIAATAPAGHVFLGERHAHHERRARIVVGLSLVTMLAELGGGALYGSVALVADGLHMSTHAGALAVAAVSYAYARRHAHDSRFGFGTGKLGDLAAFASGVGLLVVAALIAAESLHRLFSPEPVAFGQAAAVGVLGLAVSLASAVLLHHRADAHGRDLNLWAAYLHMLADVVTSVLTVGALLLGRAFGWLWTDPLAGLVGALVVASFAIGLLRSAGAVLLDMNPGAEITADVRRRLEAAGGRVADLHLWRLGPGHLGLVVHLRDTGGRPASTFRAALQGVPHLSHVTLEVED